MHPIKRNQWHLEKLKLNSLYLNVTFSIILLAKLGVEELKHSIWRGSTMTRSTERTYEKCNSEWPSVQKKHINHSREINCLNLNSNPNLFAVLAYMHRIILYRRSSGLIFGRCNQLLIAHFNKFIFPHVLDSSIDHFVFHWRHWGIIFT